MQSVGNTELANLKSFGTTGAKTGRGTSYQEGAVSPAERGPGSKGWPTRGCSRQPKVEIRALAFP